jgi:hypothetical protein
MKIDTNTINVLKNYAKINPSIIIQEGNVLKTISPSKTIMAKCTVTTNFDKKFAIYDLNRFLSILSVFDNPDISLGDNNLSIADNTKKQRYNYADENTITKIPEREISLPSVDVRFTLKNEHLKEVERAAGVLSIPEIHLSGEDGNINLKAADSKVSGGDVFSINVGNTDKTFNAIFKIENLKIIPGDYEVSICSRGISHFAGKESEYWIAVESNSTF